MRLSRQENDKAPDQTADAKYSASTGISNQSTSRHCNSRVTSQKISHGELSDQIPYVESASEPGVCKISPPSYEPCGLTLGAVEAQSLLVAKQIGVVESGFVHELQALREGEDGKNEPIDASKDCARLGRGLGSAQGPVGL